MFSAALGQLAFEPAVRPSRATKRAGPCHLRRDRRLFDGAVLEFVFGLSPEVDNVSWFKFLGHGWAPNG